MCAFPPIAPALSPPACPCCASNAFRACTDSPTDAGRPEHDEGDECIEYDLYGWFQFESHADGVQCLARQMWEPPHDWSRQKVGRRRF